MVRNKEYIIVKANLLYRLNPLILYILRLVLSIIKITFILFFVYKLRQARYLTKEHVKEYKENKPIYPFLFANKVVLLFLIAVELPPFISLILCLFNNRQDKLILADLIILKVSLVIYTVCKLTNWLRSVSSYPPLELLIRVT